MKEVISFIALILLCSCEKEANIKLPDTKPLPVLSAFISPQDTIIRAKLTMSQPLYGTQTGNVNDPVTDANIVLSSAQGNVTLFYNNVSGYYETTANVYPVNYGGTYKIAVTLANGNFAEAQTTIPGNNIPILNASVQTLTINNMPQKRYKANFNDDGATANYYRFAVVSIISNIQVPDTFYSDRGLRPLYTDLDNNGKNMEVSFQDYGGDEYGVIGYDVYLLNCNKDYFEYYKSIMNYQNGNPFAEPSLIYTNIKGGLGIFAGYTKTKYRVII